MAERLFLRVVYEGARWGGGRGGVFATYGKPAYFARRDLCIGGKKASGKIFAAEQKGKKLGAARGNIFSAARKEIYCKGIANIQVVCFRGVIADLINASRDSEEKK